MQRRAAGGQNRQLRAARPGARPRAARPPATCSKLSSTSSSSRAPQSSRPAAARSGRSPDSRTPSAWAIAGSHESRIADRGEGDEGDAVGEIAGHLVGHGDGEAGLAHPARTGQRQEADILAAQERGDLAALLVTGQEGGQGERKPSGRSGGRGGSDTRLVGRPAVSMIPILATRHAVRGMMSGAGSGVNAGIGAGNRCRRRGASTQE